MIDFLDYETRARRAFEGKDWRTASLILKKLILLEPDEEAHKMLIKCYINLHQYDLAHQTIDSSSFNQEVFRYYKSKVLRLQGKLEKALNFSNEKQKRRILNEIEDYQLGDFKDEYQEFIKWFKNNGGTKGSIKLKLFHQKFRGISAKTFIEPGTVLVSVPSHLILFADTCKQALPAGIERNFQSYHSTFACFLAQELKNPSSFWLSYLKTLPKDFINFPIYFNEKELINLEGSSLLKLIEIQKKEILDDFNIISHLEICSFDDFLQAKLIVSSRLHSIKTKQDESGLVPLADMFNHHSGSNVGWFYDFESNSFAVQANQSFERGQEICIDYGDKSNLKLMIGYGFAIENNEFDEYLLKVDFKNNDPCLELKQEIKGNRNFFHVNMKTGSRYFKELAGVLRIRFCFDRCFLTENKERFFNLKNVEVISKDNEINVLRFLRKKCIQALGLFKSEWQELDDVNSKNSFLVVQGEKNALKWMVSFCDYFLNVFSNNLAIQENKEYQDYLNSLNHSVNI
jgi:hypothetical protein